MNAFVYLFLRMETVAGVAMMVIGGVLGYRWLGIVGAVIGGVIGFAVGFVGALAIRLLG